MKLITLGTGNSPQKNRFCSCNLLEVNDTLYVFDAGAPLIDLLVRSGYDFKKVKAVFITHPHADHIAYLNLFISHANWFYGDNELHFLLPSQKSVKYAKFLANGLSESKVKKNFKFNAYKEGCIYKDENIEVFACENGHAKNSYSFVIKQGENIGVITGDLDKNYKTLTKVVFNRKTEFVLIECAHQSLEIVKDVLPKINTKNLLLTHVGNIVGVEKLNSLGFKTVNDGDVFEF